MTDEPRKPQQPGMFGHLLIGQGDKSSKQPYKAARPRRRRKGQLNDGKSAPGYGPGAKKK